MPVHVFGPVKLPVSEYVSAHPPASVVVFWKLPEGHVVAAPVIEPGFDGEEAMTAPSLENINDVTFTETRPKQHE